MLPESRMNKMWYTRITPQVVSRNMQNNKIVLLLLLISSRHDSRVWVEPEKNIKVKNFFLVFAIFYNGSNLALNGNDPLNPDYSDVSHK